MKESNKRALHPSPDLQKHSDMVSPFSAKFRLLWVPLFTLLVIMYGVQVNSHVIFAFGGDVTSYLVTAEALSEGEGYINKSFIPPEPQTRLPFFFPLILSFIIRGFGFHIPLMKWTMILIYLSGLLCYCDLTLQRGRPLFGIFAVVVAASHPFALGYSQRLLSELVYIGFSLAALWAFESAAERRRHYLPFLTASALLALLSFYTRSAGVALAAAFVLVLLANSSCRNFVKQRRVVALALVLAVAAGVSAWWIYCYAIGGAKGLYYFFELLGLPDGSPSFLDSAIGFKEALSRTSKNFVFYVGNIGKLLVPWISAHTLLMVIGSLVLALAIVGFSIQTRLYRSAHELYAVFYFIVILAWNFPEPRFMMPINVLLVFFALEGVSYIFSRFRPFYVQITLGSIATIFLATNLWLEMSKQMHSHNPPAVGINEHFRMVPLNRASWNMLRLESWIKKNMPPDGKYLIHYGNDFYLITGKGTVNFMRVKMKDTLEVLVKHRVDFVATTETFPVYDKWVKKGIKKAPQLFVPVHNVPGTNTTLYRFLHSGTLPEKTKKDY